MREIDLINIPPGDVFLHRIHRRDEPFAAKVALPRGLDLHRRHGEWLQLIEQRSHFEPLLAGMRIDEQVFIEPETERAVVTDRATRRPQGESAIRTIDFPPLQLRPQLRHVINRSAEHTLRPCPNDAQRLIPGKISGAVEERQAGQMAQSDRDLGRCQGEIDGPESRRGTEKTRQGGD